MRIFYLAVLVSLITNLHSPNVSAKIVEKTINISLIQEKINNRRFVHRIEFIDGKKAELWSIDGTAVDSQEYEEAILEAEKEELRLERRKAQEKEFRKQETLLALQKNGLIRLLATYYNQIDELAKKLSDPRLHAYLSFNQNTLSHEQFKKLINELMPRITEIRQNANSMEISELKQFIDQLEIYPDRLEQLYWSTIKNAQEKSDDTRLLKDLFSLTAEISTVD